MDRYVILLWFNQENKPNCDDVIANLARSFRHCKTWRCPRRSELHQWQSQSFISSIFFLPTEESSQNVSVSTPSQTPSKWSKVPDVSDEETTMYLQNLVHSHAASDMNKDSNKNLKPVADVIHELADNLPDAGYYVDVLWILSDSQVPEISEHVSLYGALKRIIEWHRGHITFVTTDDLIEQIKVSPWVKFLHAAVKTTDGNLIENFVWRGRINVTEQKSMSSVTLPGFVLRSPGNDISDDSRDLMSKLFPESPSPKRLHSVRKKRQEKPSPNYGLCLSGRLEFLDEVPLNTVPTFFVTSTKLELSLCESCTNSESEQATKSKILMEHITQNRTMCSFLRLWYSTRQPRRTKPVKKKDKDSKEKTGKEIWQSKLLQNEITMPEQSLTGPLDYYTFLIRPGENGGLAAYLLRQPREINGGIIEVLMKCPGPVPIHDSHVENVQMILKQIPSMSPEHVLQMNNYIFKVQTSVLQKWIDEQEERGKPATLTKEELCKLLTTVRERCIAKLPEIVPPNPTEIQDVSQMTLRLPTSELDIDPSEWLERYALTERENVEKLQRNKSMDRFGGPPPKEKEDDALKLDAAQFLKMFAPTGTPIAECLSPIKCPNAKSRLKLPKYNSVEVKDAEWPECAKFNYHGIYYNISSESEDKETRYGRIRDRFIHNETASTCTLEQKTKPTTMAMLSCISNKVKVGSKLVRKGSSDDFTKEKHAAIKRPAPPAAKKADAPPGTRSRKSPRLSKTEDAKSTKTENWVQKDKTSTAKTAEEKEKAMSRSERHKRKLQLIVEEVLAKNGMPVDNPAHKACSDRLFRVTKAFVMDLKSSYNLSQEMRKIAEEQVQMVIEFELKKNKAKSGNAK